MRVESVLPRDLKQLLPSPTRQLRLTSLLGSSQAQPNSIQTAKSCGRSRLARLRQTSRESPPAFRVVVTVRASLLPTRLCYTFALAGLLEAAAQKSSARITQARAFCVELRQSSHVYGFEVVGNTEPFHLSQRSLHRELLMCFDGTRN